MNDVIYVVVKKYLYDKDEYLAAYLSREEADNRRMFLSGEEDPDEDLEYAVWTIPFRPGAPR